MTDPNAILTPDHPRAVETGTHMPIRRIGERRWQVDLPYWNGRYATHKRTIVHGTKVDAARKMLEFAAQVRGSFTDTTVQECIDLYKNIRGQGGASSYLVAIGRDLGRIMVGKRLRTEWERYLVSLRAKGLTQATCNKYAAVMRAVLKLARDMGRFEDMPIHQWGIKAVRPRDVTLSRTQRDALLTAAMQRAPHLEPIVRFAMQVPSRRGELLALRREDLNLFGNCVRIRAENSKSGAGTWKPIPPDMVEYFRGLPADAETLFYRRTSSGQCVGLGDFKRAWKGIAKRAGVPSLRFHDLRHLAATALVDAGTPEQVVMAVAGWKTNMLRVYYHRDPRRALELVRWEQPEHSTNLAPETVATAGDGL